jgi:hypothetical protein
MLGFDRLRAAHQYREIKKPFQQPEKLGHHVLEPNLSHALIRLVHSNGEHFTSEQLRAALELTTDEVLAIKAQVIQKVKDSKFSPEQYLNHSLVRLHNKQVDQAIKQAAREMIGTFKGKKSVPNERKTQFDLNVASLQLPVFLSKDTSQKFSQIQSFLLSRYAITAEDFGNDFK